jgi:hypothetical protein
MLTTRPPKPLVDMKELHLAEHTGVPLYLLIQYLWFTVAQGNICKLKK